MEEYNQQLESAEIKRNYAEQYLESLISEDKYMLDRVDPENVATVQASINMEEAALADLKAGNTAKTIEVFNKALERAEKIEGPTQQDPELLRSLINDLENLETK